MLDEGCALSPKWLVGGRGFNMRIQELGQTSMIPASKRMCCVGNAGKKNGYWEFRCLDDYMGDVIYCVFYIAIGKYHNNKIDV